MSNAEFIEQQKAETREIIEALIADGSDPDAIYEIEHHFSADTLEELEPAMLEAFQRGFEVYEAEEIENEEGNFVFSFDVVMETALNAERIDEQVEIVSQLAEKHSIIYDGWGTYFESDEPIDDEDYIGDEDE